jgi:hypothetical protein
MLKNKNQVPHKFSNAFILGTFTNKFQQFKLFVFRFTFELILKL